MEIYNLYPGGMGANCYMAISGSSAVIIDPSASADIILDLLNKKGATLEHIILTHGHFDHILSADTLRDLTCAPLCIHSSDADFLTDSKKNAFYTFLGRDITYRPADSLLYEGDKICFGNETLTVINTPGHTEGSICLLGNDVMFTGDTLFSDTIGRCDLYSGSPRRMRDSLARLREYDKELKIYPGHGDTGVLGHALDVVSYYF